MKHSRVALAFVAAALISMGFPIGAASGERLLAAQSEPAKRVRRAAKPVPDQYIVVLAEHEDGEAIGRETEQLLGGRLKHVYRHSLKGFAIRLPRPAAERLANDPRVLFVEEDGEVAIQQSAPTWSLDRIDQRDLPLDGLYNVGATGAGVAVHVLDTGIRTTHQEFGGRAFIAADYIDDDQDGDPSDVGNDDANASTPDGADCHGHGTHVAGTVGGYTYGVAKNVTLYAHRVLACDGSGPTSGIIAAIDAVTEHPHRPAVVNMSLGGDASSALDQAVRTSIAAGVTFALAAGNHNADAQAVSPARVAEAITVGASDSADRRASFSNYGSVLDLFAPGVSITSAASNSDTGYTNMSGTSMATPHVAGVAALYLEQYPTATPAEVGGTLVDAATPNVVGNPGPDSPNLLLYAGSTSSSKPDLLSTLGALASTAIPGGTLAITETTANEATVDAPASTTRYYLSFDGGKGGGDVSLGSRSITPLAGAAGSQGSVSFTIPSTTPAAAYYVLACADDSNTVIERDEQNNCGVSAQPVTITRADLTVTAIGDPPAFVAGGGTFLMSDTVVNRGGYASVASVNRYYLSTDAAKSADDRLLNGSRAVPILAPDGTSAASSGKLTVPTTTALGVYFLLVCADDTTKNSELSEANNCGAASSQVRVGRADLVISTLSNPPAEVAPARTLAVMAATLNLGTASSGSSSTRFYLSVDATKDATDLLLSGSIAVSALSPGQTSTVSRSLTVAAATPPGTYRFIACADATAAVSELDEANNCLVSPISIQVKLPDIVQTAVSHPPVSVLGGARFAVTDTVANTGAIATGSTVTRYYFSSDVVKDGADIQLTGSRSINSLAAGATSTGSKTVTVPAMPSGTYHLLACGDDSTAAVESREDNNCVASSGVVIVP